MKSTVTYNDHPFWDVATEAYKKIGDGFTIHQKFTCAHCDARQTLEEPNKFYKTGRCEECGKITDIEKRGCNYLAIVSNG